MNERKDDFLVQTCTHQNSGQERLPEIDEEDPDISFRLRIQQVLQGVTHSQNYVHSDVLTFENLKTLPSICVHDLGQISIPLRSEQEGKSMRVNYSPELLAFDPNLANHAFSPCR